MAPGGRNRAPGGKHQLASSLDNHRQSPKAGGTQGSGQQPPGWRTASRMASTKLGKSLETTGHQAQADALGSGWQGTRRQESKPQVASTRLQDGSTGWPKSLDNPQATQGSRLSGTGIQVASTRLASPLDNTGH
eukprot:gene11268-18899_t